MIWPKLLVTPGGLYADMLIIKCGVLTVRKSSDTHGAVNTVIKLIKTFNILFELESMNGAEYVNEIHLI